MVLEFECSLYGGLVFLIFFFLIFLTPYSIFLDQKILTQKKSDQKSLTQKESDKKITTQKESDQKIMTREGIRSENSDT